MSAANKGDLSDFMFWKINASLVRMFGGSQVFIEGLSFKEILDFAGSKINILEYLLEYDY